MTVCPTRIAVLFVLITITTGVLANSVKELVVTGHDGFDGAPVIAVISSDGEAWDTVDTTATSTVNVGLRAQCRFGATRKKQPYQGTLHVPGFVQVGAAAPPHDQLHEATTASATFRFVDGVGQPVSALQICANELEERLRNEPDKSQYEIMASGFRVNVPDALVASYTLSCLPTRFGRQDSQSQRVRLNATIDCLPSDLAAAYIPAGEMTITQIDITPLVATTSLVALPNQYSGACPTSIKFAGFITASRAGEVTYRYVDQNGQASPHEHLVFTQAGRLPTRELQRVITLGRPDDATIAEDPPTPQTTDASGAATEADTPQTSVIEGAMRIEILAPSASMSDYAPYTVDCTSVTAAYP